MGGRLKEFVKFWKTITHDTNVIKAVQGLAISLSEEIGFQRGKPQIRFKKVEEDSISKDIDKMLIKGIIVPAPTENDEGEFVSQILSRSKSQEV